MRPRESVYFRTVRGASRSVSYLLHPPRMRTSFRKGFTLIELLLVIGIIAILASIVIVAINPTKQLGDARNAQRKSDVNTIISAVYQYAIDNDGNLPPTYGVGGALDPISSTDKEICATDPSEVENCIDLDVLTGSYLVRMPRDPQVRSSTGTNYWIRENANGRIIVTASGAELGDSIYVEK